MKNRKYLATLRFLNFLEFARYEQQHLDTDNSNLASHPHTKFHLLPSFESSKRLLRKACKREKKIETLRLAICNGAGHP